MSTLNPLLARFQNEPTLVSADSRAWFESCIHGASAALSQIREDRTAASMEDDFWFESSDWRSAYRPYVVRDGVLQIPVKGVLLNDFPYALGSWATGYDYIWRAFQRGLGDENVKGIALVIDSPGGMVAGNFDLVDRMFERRGEKPVRAYASESAYSAAYSIASVADSITVSRTGGVGSIGVVTSHLDVSGAMEAGGYRITFIHAGKHKVDGNAYEPLPDDVKARIQSRIDDIYSIFVSTVARNRGLDEQAVRDTEALTFSAPEALSNGLADQIGALDDALADFSASLNPTEGDETMADITQADIDNARASGVTEGTVAGQREGAVAERTRITTILDSEVALARPIAARSVALETDMSADQAATFLARLPEETTAPAAVEQGAGAPAGMFAAAMDGTQNPQVGTGDDAASDPDSVEHIFASAGIPDRKAA